LIDIHSHALSFDRNRLGQLSLGTLALTNEFSMQFCAFMSNIVDTGVYLFELTGLAMVTQEVDELVYHVNTTESIDLTISAGKWSCFALGSSPPSAKSYSFFFIDDPRMDLRNDLEVTLTADPTLNLGGPTLAETFSGFLRYIRIYSSLLPSGHLAK